MADEYKVKIKELPLLNSADSLSLDTFMIAERGEADSPTSKMQLSTLKTFLQRDDFDRIAKSLKSGNNVKLTIDADAQQITIDIIDDGKTASKWYAGDAPTVANEGDCLLKNNGAIYRYNGIDWVNTNINLTGPQGEQGIQGPQGENGQNGLNGRAGEKGADGEDGFSPYIITMPLDNEGYSFTVVNKDGSNEYIIRNGANGVDGKNGEKGADGLTPTITIDEDTKHWIINGEDSGVRADPNSDDYFSFDKINDLDLITEINNNSNFLVMTDKKPYQIAFESFWKLLGSFITVDTDSGLKQEWTEDNKLSIAISAPLADIILVDNETIFKKDDNSIYVVTATENTKGLVQPDNDTIVIKDGVISATAQTPKIATAEDAGIVKPDNKTIGISDDGTLVLLEENGNNATAVISDTLTLFANNWTQKVQKINTAIDIYSYNIVNIPIEDIKIWGKYKIYATKEERTGITFSCGTVPEQDLTFTVTTIPLKEEEEIQEDPVVNPTVTGYGNIVTESKNNGYGNYGWCAFDGRIDGVGGYSRWVSISYGPATNTTDWVAYRYDTKRRLKYIEFSGTQESRGQTYSLIITGVKDDETEVELFNGQVITPTDATYLTKVDVNAEQLFNKFKFYCPAAGEIRIWTTSR